jgi:hypothetical protein
MGWQRQSALVLFQTPVTKLALLPPCGCHLLVSLAFIVTPASCAWLAGPDVAVL